MEPEKGNSLFPTAVDDAIVGQKGTKQATESLDAETKSGKISPPESSIQTSPQKTDLGESKNNILNNLLDTSSESDYTSNKQTPANSSVSTPERSNAPSTKNSQPSSKINSSSQSPRDTKESESSSSSSSPSPRSNSSSSRQEKPKELQTQNDPAPGDEVISISGEPKDNNEIIITYESGPSSKKHSVLNTPNKPSSPASSSSSSSRSQENRNQQKPKSKPPPEKPLTHSQEMKRIPSEIRNNPYVAKRLNTYPVKNTKPPRAATSNGAAYRQRPKAELDEYTQALLEGNPPEEKPTIEQLNATCRQLRCLERDLVDEGKYLEAKKAATALEKASKQLSKTTKLNTGKSNIEEMVSKRNELLILAETATKEFDEQINNHKNVTSEKRREIIENQQRELDEFDKNLPTELEPAFRRNSVTYHNMRSKEKNLALNRHFDEADALQKAADKLAQEENEANFEKMNKYYEEKRERLVNLHQLTIQNFNAFSKSRLSEIQFQKSKTVDPIMRRVENLERQIERQIEERGIKPEDIDLDKIDYDKVEKMMKTEGDTPIPKFRPASQASKNSPKTPKIQKPKVNRAQKI